MGMFPFKKKTSSDAIGLNPWRAGKPQMISSDLTLLVVGIRAEMGINPMAMNMMMVGSGCSVVVAVFATWETH